MLLFILLLLSLVFSYVLNLVFINFAGRLGSLSRGETNQIRWASTSKPLVGGMTFFIVFLIGIVITALLPEVAPLKETADYIPFLITLTLGFLVGLADDAFTTKPILKFIGQMMCAAILIAFDVRIELFDIAILDNILTILWVVGLMNSINMLDNMDAVTGSVSLLIVSFVVATMAFSGQMGDVYFFLLVSTVGSLLGFLVLNWNPSKLYMGDTGSQFLGMLLAFIGIKYLWNMPNAAGQLEASRQILAPLLVFLMPIMDTTFVSIARLSRGQSPFVGGRDHTTHHLVYLGLQDRYVPIITGLVGIMGGTLMLTMFMIEQWSAVYTVLYAGFVLAMFGIFTVIYRKGARLKRLREVQKKRTELRLALQPVVGAAALEPARQHAHSS